MSSPIDSQPIPVADARDLANRRAKDLVVIFTWDRASNMIQIATWGREVEHKILAGKLSTMFAQAAGCDLSKEQTHEDFRTLTKAEWAKERDGLLARIAELEKGGAR